MQLESCAWTGHLRSRHRVRRYPTPGMQQQREAQPAWGKGGFVDLVLWPVFFYFLWAVLYYVQARIYISGWCKVVL